MQAKRSAKRFAPLSRVTLPGFACVDGHILPESTPAKRVSSETNRKLQIAAASLSLQGHGITVALRTLVARRALTLTTKG